MLNAASQYRNNINSKRNIVDLLSKLVPNPKIKILTKGQDKRNYKVGSNNLTILIIQIIKIIRRCVTVSKLQITGAK